MKQGTNFILPIQIGYDLSQVKSIDFIFKQPTARSRGEFSTKKIIDGIQKTFTYPSKTAVLSSTEANVVNLYWTEKDTFSFAPDEYIYMDTKIVLKESDQNPETEICKIKMLPTLFLKEK